MFYLIKLITASLMLMLVQNTFANNFQLKTTAFKHQGRIPTAYTCDGENISPVLSWEGIPTQTQSLTLIMVDPDAPTRPFYHWVITTIPKNIKNLPSALKPFPAGMIVGKNSFGHQTYEGPCPPQGSIHHYEFTLYALDAKLTISSQSTPEMLLDAIQNHVLDKAKLIGIYKRK